MPSKYLFTVNSKPTGCDEATWEKWYTEDHIPDLIAHGAATRAAFYRETYDDSPSITTEKFSRKYLAFYQTNHEQLLNSEEQKRTKDSSELFPGKSKAIGENGEFDARNYELVHEFDPKGLGDSPAPVILWAELEHPDGDELHKFYEEEHFPLLGKVPGYRRGLRYKIGPESPLKLSKPATYLAIHEWDKKHGMEGTPEMAAVTATPWTAKVLGDVSFSVLRTFELVKTVGY